MLDELRHFIAVLDEGTMTAAARRVHLSQPALSASIRRLEAATGARLLDRARGVPAEPTAAGIAMAGHARSMLASWRSGLRDVAELSGLQRGVVRIGAGATACTYLLPEIVTAFRAAHPGIGLQLIEGRSDAVRERVADGALDIGIVAASGVAFPGPLNELSWRCDELVVIAPPALTAADAADLPFVTFAPGSPTRSALQRGIDTGAIGGGEIAMELGNIAAIKAHVRAGVGRALVTRSAVIADVSAGRLQILPTPKIVRQLSVVHRRRAGLSHASAAFLVALGIK